MHVLHTVYITLASPFRGGMEDGDAVPIVVADSVGRAGGPPPSPMPAAEEEQSSPANADTRQLRPTFTEETGGSDAVGAALAGDGPAAEGPRRLRHGKRDRIEPIREKRTRPDAQAPAVVRFIPKF